MYEYVVCVCRCFVFFSLRLCVTKANTAWYTNTISTSTCTQANIRGMELYQTRMIISRKIMNYVYKSGECIVAYRIQNAEKVVRWMDIVDWIDHWLFLEILPLTCDGKNRLSVRTRDVFVLFSVAKLMHSIVIVRWFYISTASSIIQSKIIWKYETVSIDMATYVWYCNVDVRTYT